MSVKRYQTGLRVPCELADQLVKEAEAAGMSMNAYILMLIQIARQEQQSARFFPQSLAQISSE